MSGERETSRRHVYGRTKGKALRPRQVNLMETLYPGVSISLGEGFLDPRGHFGDVDDVWLEIGFGGGEHLVHQAKSNPRVGFIGCEPFLNGMAKALAAVDEAGLTNVRLHFGDAVEVLDRLPDASLAGVDLLYPDPWPKKRHWKRRFVAPDRVARVARVLAPGAPFRVASDIPSYIDWTLQHLIDDPVFRWTARTADDWRRPYPGWPGTRYEAKAIREGRPPAYLTFSRSSVS